MVRCIFLSCTFASLERTHHVCAGLKSQVLGQQVRTMTGHDGDLERFVLHLSKFDCCVL